jgi:hypothetical protein
MNWAGCEPKLSGPDQPLQNLCDGVDVNPQSGYSALQPRFEPRTSRTQTTSVRASSFNWFVRLLALRPLLAFVPASGDSEDDCGEADGM